MQTLNNASLPALELANVSKIFSQKQRGKGFSGFLHPIDKRVCALDDVSLTIPRGQFVAYAGPNGAGKSTTFKLLCGMLAPDVNPDGSKGTVRVLGQDPIVNRIPIMNRIGVLFGNRTELWWDHPIMNSFEWKKSVWGIDDATYQRMLKIAVDELDIEPILHTFARELSLGQRMRADLAMLLLHDPEIILLDEPTLGLDVLSKQHMIKVLRRLNSRGATILVTSHDMDDLQHMAERIVLLSGGRIQFDGNFDTLLSKTARTRLITLTIAPESINAARQTRIPNATLTAQSANRLTYQVDLTHSSMPEVMASLAALTGLEDIESARPPIEDVIADLYKDWNGAPRSAG